jgi:hypothetical protein
LPESQRVFQTTRLDSKPPDGVLDRHRRESLWALSHCGPVDYALDKRYFAAQGLFSLEHHYREMRRVIAPVQLTLALE